MANVQAITRDYLLRARTEGVAETTAAAQKLGTATDALATKTEKVTASQVSVQAALEKTAARFNDIYRSTNQLAAAQQTLERARAQGLGGTAVYDAAAAAVQNLKKRHDDLVDSSRVLTGQQKAAGIVLQDLQGKFAAAAGATGTYGAAFAALGPTALLATAAIGGTVIAINAMSAGAHELAEKAQDLRRFSEATGLTTAQVQALRSEASKFGVTSEEAQTAIQHFTARFDELRRGQGALLEQVRRVNPALADQMQMTTDAGQALTLFAQGLSKVDDVFQRNALVKAATGRGGLSAAAFLSSLNVDQLTASYINAGKGLDDNLIKKIAQLDIDIKKTSGAAKQNIESIFAQPVLEAELRFVQNIKALSDVVKSFSVSDDMKSFFGWIVKLNAIPTIGPILNLARIATSPIGRGTANDNFANRFQPSIDNPLKPFTPAPAQTGKTLEAQVADMKTLISILGPAATEQEKFNLKLKELQLEAKNAGVSAEALARAQAALNAEFKLAGLREMVSTLGAAATPAEQLALKIGELDQKLRTGAISQETYNRTAADFKVDQQITALRNNIAALGAAATSTEQYKLKVAELEQQLARGQISQETFTRAVREADPAFQFAKSSFESFSQSLAQGLLANKSLVDSLHDSFNNLAQMALNAGIKNLLEGNFAMAAVDAVVTIGAKIASGFTDDSQAKELQKAKKAWFDMTGELKQFEATASGFDLSGPAAQINSLRETYNKLNVAAFAAKDYAGMQKALTAFGGNLTQVVKGFEDAQSPMSDFAKQITTLTDQATQLAQTLFENGSALGSEVLAKLPAQIDALKAKASESLTAGINDAQGKGFINDLTALFSQVQQFKNDQSITGVPTSLINDYFVAQAQKIVDDANLVGSSFNDLLRIFPQLTGQVHESNAALQQQADAQKQLQDSLDQAAKSIVDYINGVNLGSSSTLSPQQQLAQAQSVYNQTLSLAQGGNVDALKRVSSDAENLRKALQDMFASGTGYAQGWQAIQAQLLALPAVSQTTDPVTAAVRDAIVAIQGTTTAVGSTTAAVHSNTDTTVDTNDAIAASNSLLGAINTLSDRFVNAINGLGALTASIGTTHQNTFTHMDQVLVAIMSNSSSAGGGGGTLWSWLGFSRGGRVPGFADGGYVGNGAFGVDSVMARLPGGQPIGLAGGEFVTQAASVNSATLAALNYINNTGRVPTNDNGRDYTPHFAQVARVTAAGANAIVATLETRLGAIEGELQKLNRSASKPVLRQPGGALEKKAS